MISHDVTQPSILEKSHPYAEERSNIVFDCLEKNRRFIMKALITSTFAIMILAGGIGTFVPNDQDHFGTSYYWEQVEQNS